MLYAEGGILNDGRVTFHLQVATKKGNVELHFESKNLDQHNDLITNLNTILDADLKKLKK